MTFSVFFMNFHAYIQILGGFIIQIFFALAVLSDAVQIQDKGQKMVFVSGKIWALATLFGGVFVILAYWIIHHSTLRPPTSDSAPLD